MRDSGVQSPASDVRRQYGTSPVRRQGVVSGPHRRTPGALLRELGLVHHLDLRFVADAVPVVSEDSTDLRWWAAPGPTFLDSAAGEPLHPVDAHSEPDTGLVARAVARLGSPRRLSRYFTWLRR